MKEFAGEGVVFVWLVYIGELWLLISTLVAMRALYNEDHGNRIYVLSYKAAALVIMSGLIAGFYALNSR